MSITYKFITMPEDFFDEQLPGSKIKTKIVTSYFRQYTRIITKYASKIGYLDFFSGPGKYEDGSDSTPILIIKSAIADEKLKNSLVTIFNDKESANVEKLNEEISKVENIADLKYKPVVNNFVVGGEVVEEMRKINLIPSFIFIDPWGYKGLSLELIASVIKDWGCDCVFFFNYNRINAAITNSFMENNINSIFGEGIANELRKLVVTLNPEQREAVILEKFMDALKGIKGQYSIKFKFFQEDGSKTSHFLIFVTKNVLGYRLMKEIMATNCGIAGGIPTYEYNPVADNKLFLQPTLFSDDNYGIRDLCDILLAEYKGKTTTRKKIYEEHNIGKPYIENNYKEALLLLESESKIVIEPSAEKRKKYQGKSTLGEEIIIKFKN